MEVIHRFGSVNTSKMHLYTELYTLSTGFGAEKSDFRYRKYEHAFCAILLKIIFLVKKAIFLLTISMSKICKKLVKLLQNNSYYVILFIQ